MQKIVYVEDNATLVKIMTMVLSSYYEVKSFVSSSDAIEYIKSHSSDIDVVLSDYKMPEFNGLDVLRVAKEIIPYSVRILLTGYADSDMIDKGDGIFDLLLDKNKYSDLESIKSKIDEAMESK